MADPCRDPLPPPFPVGTRLRCIKGFDAYVAAVDHPRHTVTDHPEDWTRVSGVGIEVTIDSVVQGRRGTGRQLRDEDGLMFYEDSGEPILDETRDGYSVYHVVSGNGHAAKMSGRCIRPDDAEERWLEIAPVRKVRTYVLFRSSFRYESAPNISHETIDGVKTLCGRKVADAETNEPDSNDLEPDCRTCARIANIAKQRQQAKAAP